MKRLVTSCLLQTGFVMASLFVHFASAETTTGTITATIENNDGVTANTSATAQVSVQIKKPESIDSITFDYPLKGGLFIAAPAPLASIPHNPDHFTQGLVYHQGSLYESTGLYGKSKLVELDASSGEILRERKVPDQYFAEGLALNNDKLYQLTWKQGKAFVYNRGDFSLLNIIDYSGEGWGASFNEEKLYITNGSENIIKIENNNNFKNNIKTKTFLKNNLVKNLNEIEFINNYIWANVWQTNSIVVINPVNGEVVNVIDFNLPLPQDSYQGQNVLNGIAYNHKNGDLYITGKLFKKIYKYNIKQFI